MADTGIIDEAALKRLLRMIGGDPEDLAELIEDFREEGPALVRELRAAAAAGDAQAARRHAHTLKGNANDFGATALAAHAAALESALKENRTDGMHEAAEAIAAEEEACREALAGIDVETLRA